jgi:hypothetical protein
MGVEGPAGVKPCRRGLSRRTSLWTRAYVPRIRTWLIYLRFATQLISALPCLTIWSVMILEAHPNFNAYAAYDRFNP